MRKYSYWLLIGALLFIIVQDPNATGSLIRAFFAWIGDGIGALFEFIASVLGQDTAGGGPVIVPDPVPSPTVSIDPLPTATDTVDQALGHLRSRLA